MSTRKRRISPNQDQLAEHQRSKRAKLISTLWQPQGESDPSYRSKTSHESVYSVKAIIGEKPGEYLIDWADNKRTGETYSPNWVGARRAQVKPYQSTDIESASESIDRVLCGRPQSLVISNPPSGETTGRYSSKSFRSRDNTDSPFHSQALTRDNLEKSVTSSVAGSTTSSLSPSLNSLPRFIEKRYSDDMAEANSSASFEPTAQTSSTPEMPVKRIPFKDRLKLLREQQYESTKRFNEAARASNHNQFQTRPSASPRRVINDSMTAPTPTQASSPHAPSGSLPANRPFADSRGTATPSQGSSPQIGPDPLPASRPPPESRPTFFHNPISSPHTPPSLLPTTRAPQDTRLAANANQGPFRQVQPGSLPANGPMEARSPSSHLTKSHTPLRVAGHSLEQQQTPTAPQQPLVPQQPQVLMTPDQQSRHMVPPVAVPVEVPLVVSTSQEGQHIPVEPNFAPYYPASSYPPRNDSLKPYKLTPNEHTISLAMNVRVRDQYVGIIRMYQRAIMELMHSDSPSEECLQEIQKLRDRVDKITTHSDLDAREIPEDPTQTSPNDEARWAENCSFKFQFLRHFLDHIRNSDMHVGIVARPGRSLDIIETYLKGRGIAYFRPDGKGASLPNDPRFAQCKCQVSVVPSGPEGMNLAVKRASLVIAFDASVNVQELQVHRMRIREGCDWLMPLAHLLVYKSAEHITRCLPLQMEPMNWLRKIVSCMTQVRHEVGVLQPEDCDVVVAGQEAGISLELGGQERRWTLPEIRPISLGFLESSRDSSTQEDSQSSQSQEGAIQSSALKRTWDPDAANTDMMKRQRMSPAGNVSHVSNSTIQSSP
ncbi:MAG: hypothetical protein Q9181_006502, partial [Wetmoreana brouardii]